MRESICRRISAESRRQAGFTLVEVLVALAIMAITLVAVFQLQSQSVSMSSESRFATSAALLAQSKMAEIEAGVLTLNRTQEGNFGPDYPQYSWRVDIFDTQLEQFKKIEVTVSNKDMQRRGDYRLVLYKVQ